MKIANDQKCERVDEVLKEVKRRKRKEGFGFCWGGGR